MRNALPDLFGSNEPGSQASSHGGAQEIKKEDELMADETESNTNSKKAKQPEVKAEQNQSQ